MFLLNNTAMDRGMISIVGGRVVVTPATGINKSGAIVDDSVWMTKHQIADLFGCFVAKVSSNIAAVLTSGVLDESRVCRFHRYKDGGGVEFYNLEMVTALAFRIDTRNAAIFRRWLIERAVQSVPKFQPPITVLFQAREQALPN
jgi:hypothetical protein